LKAQQSVLEITRSPQNDGVATAAKLVGNLHIGRLIGGRHAQDQAATKGQSLRRGMGSAQRLQAILRFEVQNNRRSKWIWHATSLPRDRGDLPA